MKITKEIAECVGLWLAEGNNKCNNEITFTNNSYDLILYFDDVLSKLFETSSKRLYVYSANGQNININSSAFIFIKYYEDNRATKPYFMWRLASVEKMKQWKLLVEFTLSQKKHYPDILRGFFAGEGNIKTGSHGNRVLRIAQKTQKDWISNILLELGFNFSFEASHRQYIISGKWNWDIFAKLKLADLHPLKNSLFWSVYSGFKQDHYQKLFLHKVLLSDLKIPRTARWLSEKYHRSQDRIAEVLSELKSNGKVVDIRIGCTNIWKLPEHKNKV
ncbi:hypothetical protein JXB27_03255 [Candidatus Woesearchaeota archaeon]|nr:hypothetical protein [Candidatus Woesearchaeota archaeon]